MLAGYATHALLEAAIRQTGRYLGVMRVLIVYAHHEPSSFNGGMLSVARETLIASGHEVCVSDLYAMGFDPVSDRRNFTTVADPDRLDQQAEERLASTTAGFAADVAAEIDKLLWCDVLVLQFPVWWMSMPAIMKGWIDRVFALGVAYGGGRWFDRGRLAGRSAMLAITVGGDEQVYSPEGMYGSIEIVTHSINHAILGFSGFAVIEPFIVYGPGRMNDSERAAELDRYADRLRAVSSAPRLPQVRSVDFERAA
jgi:NAD(P)H dehydrogenase (quinone)